MSLRPFRNRPRIPCIIFVEFVPTNPFAKKFLLCNSYIFSSLRTFWWRSSIGVVVKWKKFLLLPYLFSTWLKCFCFVLFNDSFQFSIHFVMLTKYIRIIWKWYISSLWILVYPIRYPMKSEPKTSLWYTT